jgi:ribosomal protein S18 acetylase RimI-like enzyme
VPVEIRPARPSDEDALWTLDRAHWTTLSSPAPLPPPERPFFHERCRIEDVLVALVDDELVGYVRLGPATPLAATAHVLQVQGLSVGAAFRRRGVGRALLDAAVREAGSRALPALFERVHIGVARAGNDAGTIGAGLLAAQELGLSGHTADDKAREGVG